MQLPPQFIENIQAAYGKDGQAWLDNLDQHLAQLSKRWDLKAITPVANLSYHFVAIVQFASGKSAILKTVPAGAHLMLEAEWLKAHAHAVPQVYHMDRELNAFCMEKIEPGITLKAWMQHAGDDEATRVIAQTILDLQVINPTPQHHYPRLADHIKYFDFLRGHVDASMIDSAEKLFRDLCADRSHNRLLHGDLHHDNILQRENGWAVIDPHGYWGDPCAEIGPMMYNPLDDFPNDRPLKTILQTRLKILAEMLPFDEQRIKAWAFCLALRSAAWDIEGFGTPNPHTLRAARFFV